MKFARVVFAVAGVLGVLIMAPMFFMFDRIGRQYPPVITHPDFYYGFVCVTLAWQVAFLVIATDPVRYRPLMPVAMLEKFPYVIMLLVLYARGQLAAPQLFAVAVDGTLGMLFLVAYLKTRRPPSPA